jgi:uncharacterized protein YodC (DUF2158 family)
VKIKIGDVVEPTCGGPKMTVEKVDDDVENSVHTVWFDEQNQLHRASLRTEGLKVCST